MTLLGTIIPMRRQSLEKFRTFNEAAQDSINRHKQGLAVINGHHSQVGSVCQHGPPPDFSSIHEVVVEEPNTGSNLTGPEYGMESK